MSYYYVIYKDEEGDTGVRRFNSVNLAAWFIERKLKNEPGYELGDFEVVKGSPLSVQAETRTVIHLGE